MPLVVIVVVAENDTVGVSVPVGYAVLDGGMVGENDGDGVWEADAVVLGDVPKGVTVVGIPARILMRRKKADEECFEAYGMPTESMPDPVARSVDSLRRQVSAMMARIEELEERLEDEGAAGTEKQTTPRESAGAGKT